MTINEFYNLIEEKTNKTRDDIKDMPLSELTLFIKDNFDKHLQIKFI